MLLCHDNIIIEKCSIMDFSLAFCELSCFKTKQSIGLAANEAFCSYVWCLWGIYYHKNGAYCHCNKIWKIVIFFNVFTFFFVKKRVQGRVILSPPEICHKRHTKNSFDEAWHMRVFVCIENQLNSLYDYFYVLLHTK